MPILRPRIPVCLVKYENLSYVYFGSRYKKSFEDIQQQIFFLNIHKNLMLGEGGVS